MFEGSMVALVTPMHQGCVDMASLESLVAWHMAEGSHALVILGTTGESVTLSFEEREQIVAHVIKQVAGKIPVIVGTGSLSTDHTVTLTQHAKDAGADACLIVTPYYNKPSQEGLYQHFSTVAQQVAIPQILYNVPSRTGCDLLPETVARLAEHEMVVGLKDATGDLARVTQMIEVYGAPLDLFSGDDMTTMEFILLGGQGVVSVTANIAPAVMAQMTEALQAGKIDSARRMNAKLRLLHRDLFVDANPVPVKWLLAHMNKIASSEVRLPLVALADDKRACLKHALNNLTSGD